MSVASTNRGPVAQYDGRVTDIHAHLWLGQEESDRRVILEACETYGIDKVYVSCLREYYPDESEIRDCNLAVSAFVRDHPDRIGGMCYINPRHANALDILRRGLETQGFTGMKLWVATFCDVPEVDPLIDCCATLGRPVLLHAFKKVANQLADESLASHVAALAKRHPDAHLIMAHIGGTAYDGIRILVPYTNVSVDISGSFFRGDEVDYTRELLGAERILFGSDLPGASYLVNLGQILEANLTPAERDAILHGNADRIFGR